MLFRSKLRADIRRAMVFMICHNMARKKLQMYVNRFDDMDDSGMQACHEMIQAALEVVLSESRNQSKLADDLLEDAATENDLVILQSHHCAMLILRQLITFTESKVEDDLLGKQMGRKYVKAFEERVRETDIECDIQLATMRRTHASQTSSAGRRLSKLISVDDDINNLSQSLSIMSVMNDGSNNLSQSLPTLEEQSESENANAAETNGTTTDYGTLNSAQVHVLEWNRQVD